MEVLKFSEMRLKKDKVVFQLPIHKIRSNPYQPRKYFNRAALEELADSIRAYGILQPITVRKMSGGAYELVAGERRLRAAELAGLETIPAILMQVSDSDSAVMAFIENIQRQNLSFLEEAEGYRNMMEDYGLTQEELADRAELSKGFISQLERNLTSPSIATLTDILQCLGTTLGEFFNETPEEQVVFGKADYFEKYDAELKNEIRWIIPNAQKNMMEPILITLEAGGSTYPDNPHEGEEFGYVLQGSISIHIGSKTYRAKKGESFYFTPDKKHYLTSRHGASLIWVSTPPSF